MLLCSTRRLHKLNENRSSYAEIELSLHKCKETGHVLFSDRLSLINGLSGFIFSPTKVVKIFILLIENSFDFPPSFPDRKSTLYIEHSSESTIIPSSHPNVLRSGKNANKLLTILADNFCVSQPLSCFVPVPIHFQQALQPPWRANFFHHKTPAWIWQR